MNQAALPEIRDSAVRIASIDISVEILLLFQESSYFLRILSEADSDSESVSSSVEEDQAYRRHEIENVLKVIHI